MSVITTSQISKKPFDGLHWLEKASSGKVTIEDIGDALEEFARLFTAGISSKAETLTLSRAFPHNRQYTEAAANMGDDDEPMVVGGPASVSLIDREGHLITTDALKKAFQKFMGNFRTRNAMVLHSDVQVGWALPAYISKGGQIFKSGVDDKGLFFICELRDDTKISEKVKKEINEGRLKSYSIAGSALKVQNMQKGLMPYMQVDEMELAEVTVCEKGVNQNAGFELLKSEMPQTGQIDKDQCGYRDATPEESAKGIDCGHCKYFNAEDKSCDVVTGHILPGDYCKIFAPMAPKPTKVVVVMRNKENVDFKKSFDMWLAKAETVKDPLKSKESLAVLDNFAGREAEHHQLLREYGFPSEQPSESSRYVPVIETETDDKGVPIHIKPPWIVNEAGQDLGEKLDEDSPDYNKSDKAKNRKKAKSIQKMGFLFKAPPPTRHQRQARATAKRKFDTGRQKTADEYRTSAEEGQRRQSESMSDMARRFRSKAGTRSGREREETETARTAAQGQRDTAAAGKPRYARGAQPELSGYGGASLETPSAPKRPGFLSRVGRRLSRGGRAGRIKEARERPGKFLEALKRQSGPGGVEEQEREKAKQVRAKGRADKKAAGIKAEEQQAKKESSYLDRLKGRSAKDERKADYAHAAGGPEGRTMSYDDHDTAFKNYHENMSTSGRATMREHLDALDRFGHTNDNKRLFTVHRKDISDEDMDKTIHVNEFADMLKTGKVGMKTSQAYAQHENAITGMGKNMSEGGSMQHLYINHLNGYANDTQADAPYAPNVPNAPPSRGGPYNTPKPTGIAAEDIVTSTPPRVAEMDRTPLGRYPGPTDIRKPVPDAFKPMSTDKAVIDKMLKKAVWGGK